MNSNHRNNFAKEEDVVKESVNHLIVDRIPWLLLGLLGGILATFIIAKYEAIISSDVRLAFFIPIIVYLSDALGTQTETIYVRALAEKKKLVLSKYIFKETLIGFALGAISGIILGLFSSFWLSSISIGITIGLTMLINLTIAPLLAIFIPSILYRQHADPALGAGPVATVMQDLFSLLIYFFVISLVIF